MVLLRPLLLLSLLLDGSGCFQQDSAKTSQILPLGYESSYVQARGCRLIRGHTSNYIIVRANSSEVQQAYVAGNGPLPQGSVILAEEYDRADCLGIAGFTLMYKDVQGYNPDAADWHWQRLDSLRDVLEDGRVETCISCHAQCSLNDYTCSPP